MPSKISLANLPTRIDFLPKVSKRLGVSLYIKRDDQTGSEYSGNKVRKIEFAVAEALAQGCDTLITCGGIQSNHCRATAAVAAKVGLASILLLRTDEAQPEIAGNYFLDKILGAEVRFCSRDDYRHRRNQMMADIVQELAAQGRKGYILAEGASNGIGCFGYYHCMQEIVAQEKAMGLHFDTIVVAEGSGGTHAGLHLANKVLGLNKRVIAFCVCDDRPYFQDAVAKICAECTAYGEMHAAVSPEEVEVIDHYVGIGYALSRPEELDFIAEIARENGIILDPVYTGKAFYGLCQEIAAGRLKGLGNILFIHTGGLFGLFPKQAQFNF